MRTGFASNVDWRRAGAVIIIAAAALLCAPPAAATAQVLRDDWVTATHHAIETHRKTPIRIIVLDEQGQPITGTRVHIQMLAHDFEWGIKIHPRWLDDTQGRQHLFNSHDEPVWRAFSAVSLEAISAWTRTQPQPDAHRWDEVDAVLEHARQRQWHVRWGALISADHGRWPEHAINLQGDALRHALLHHQRAVMLRYGRQVHSFDIIGDLTGRDTVTDRLGVPMARALYEQAQAHAPDATRLMRFDDSFAGHRLADMSRHMLRMNESFVPVDGVAIQLRMRGQVLQPAMQRSLDWIERMRQPVIICDFEVSGSSEAAASIHVETALRTLFARPMVQGIYFAGVHADEVDDPAAALIDKEGRLTRTGDVVDRLIREVWWTDQTLTTDFAGNVRARVYAGRYRITTTLPDGKTIETLRHLPRADEPHVIILEPLKHQHSQPTPQTTEANPGDADQ